MIAEHLVRDFNGAIPLPTVISVLRERAHQHPDDPPELPEQAARIQLQIRSQGES